MSHTPQDAGSDPAEDDSSRDWTDEGGAAPEGPATDTDRDTDTDGAAGQDQDS